MTFKTKLAREERRTLRRIAKEQLRSLHRLKDNDSAEDLIFECALQGINHGEVLKQIEKEITIFEGLWERPSKFLMMSRESQSKVRHILANLPEEYECPTLWRKFFLAEDFYYHPN